MFGLTAEKLALICLLALLIVGPQRLPAYASQLAKWVKAGRKFFDDSKARLSDELGPEFDDIDWKKLDPRQYDPRRIIREALTDEVGNTTATRAAATKTPTEPLASDKTKKKEEN